MSLAVLIRGRGTTPPGSHVVVCRFSTDIRPLRGQDKTAIFSMVCSRFHFNRNLFIDNFDPGTSCPIDFFHNLQID